MARLRAPRSTGIAGRLGLGFAALLAVMTLVVGVAAWQARAIANQLDAVVNQQIPRMLKVGALARVVSDLNVAARDAIISAGEPAGDAALARIESGRTQVGQQIEDLQRALRTGDPRGEKAATELGDQSSGILVALVKFGRVLKAHNLDMARSLLASNVQPRISALGAAVDNAQALQQQMLGEASERSNRAWRIALAEIAATLVGAVALATLLAWRIARGVTRPVQDAVRLAERIAAGDLREMLRVDRTDELGRLQQALADMQARLGHLVGQIHDVAEHMAQASAEISSGSNDLSHRTEQAASALQEAASSMTLLSSQVRENAQAASSANALAADTAEVAQRGGELVGRVIASMSDISQASRRIGEITGVIDGISFQTNILALNAAVEAARAGDHGRGFAVVAGEVRSLAQRAATAAKEIKALITASTEQVDSGSRLVQSAGGTMSDIVDGARKVTSIVSGISEASERQSGDLGRVNETVGGLDAMTQQNSALVEQSAAAAQNMREQSLRLQAMVNTFKLAPAA
jgi:methyl-accepting chemotaxis protein